MKDDEAPGSSGRKKLEDLNWDHSFVRELPGDERVGGPVRQVHVILIRCQCFLMILCNEMKKLNC